ncbi:MAG: MOSC domain-containing protein [Candidatus Poseidoniales archaeon]|nr:MAG: MOSC domain-containing protein [Candidatus Poseidoniales archaeon]
MKGSIVGLFAAPEGGVPKPLVEQLEVRVHGCVGDYQRDKKHHGGPNRAVCLFSSEVISHLQENGHPIFPGSVGENILVEGIQWEHIGVGSVFRFGSLTLEVTSDAPPCKTIQDSFTNGRFKEISVKIAPNMTRWYAKVIKEGHVKIGDDVVIN